MKKRIVLILILIFASCNNVSSNRYISITDISLIKEKKFIIFFYTDTCKACNDALDIMERRYKNKKYQGFFVNIDTKETTISQEKISNINKRKDEEISLYSFPYLLYFNENIVVKEVYGYTNILKENLYIFFE